MPAYITCPMCGSNLRLGKAGYYCEVCGWREKNRGYCGPDTLKEKKGLA